METLRLQTKQQTSHVNGLQHSLVKSLQIVPDDADAVTDRSELPSALQKIVITAKKEAQSWCAWIDRSSHVWLFVAEMSLPLSRKRDLPVLHLKYYREHGLRETGAWLIDRQGKWRRCVD